LYLFIRIEDVGICGYPFDKGFQNIGSSLKSLRRVDSEYPPFVKHRHPVTQTLRFFHVVGARPIVLPSFRSWRMSSHSSRRVFGSNPVLGSSRKTISGSRLTYRGPVKK
jgi:hypothetical protein